jgi:hypothetical protein
MSCAIASVQMFNGATLEGEKVGRLDQDLFFCTVTGPCIIADNVPTLPALSRCGARCAVIVCVLRVRVGVDNTLLYYSKLLRM